MVAGRSETDPGVLPPELTLEMERLALRTLALEYDELNRTLFRGQLKRPALSFSDSVRRLGQWTPEPPEVSISRELVLKQPWLAVVEVLKHEMAHQFVQQVLGVQETAHGPVFRQACRERGIDPTAAGLSTSELGAPSGVLRKVLGLLSLAQSQNRNEAEAAMGAAQRIMLKHNLEHLEGRDEREFRVAQLGTPSGRVQEAERILATILGEFFFVEALWVRAWRPQEGKPGSVLEVCGTPENVELASYVHSFLLRAGERLWKEHKRAHGIANNRDRRRYLSGVMNGFYRKLNRERRQQQKQGLVWLGDAALQGFFRRRHPYVQTITYQRGRASEAFAAGTAAGSQLVLHRGMEGASGGRIRQLTSGRRA